MNVAAPHPFGPSQGTCVGVGVGDCGSLDMNGTQRSEICGARPPIVAGRIGSSGGASPHVSFLGSTSGIDDRSGQSRAPVTAAATGTDVLTASPRDQMSTG